MARTITVSTCLMLLILSLTSRAAAQSSATNTTQPNVIIMMADDLGYGDLGAYGSTLIATPNLDRMSQQGALLTSFYSSANVCTAARGGLLSGRYPIRLDLVLDVARPTNDIGISDFEITLGEALQDLGYATALVGKWHLGEEVERSPLRHGFDQFYGLLHSNDMAPVELYRDTQMIEFPVDQTTLTQRYTEEAIGFIEANQESPFFLYLPHSFPHVPLFVNDEFNGTSDAGLYGDVVETIDWSVGEIQSTLARLGLSENTLIIFTSDNGPWFEGSAGPYRERKGTAWDGGLRVPFIASWPGVIPAGTVSHEPAMNIDLFPTIVKLAGGELPDDRAIDGKDIMPVLTQAAASPHEFLFLFDKDRIAGVRSGNWKLVTETKYQTSVTRFDHPNSYYGSGLLFDLAKDPSETYSFGRENPEVVQRLLQYLEQGRQELSAYVPEQMWSSPNQPR